MTASIMWLRAMMFHILASYYITKEVSAALLALCPGLLTPSAYRLNCAVDAGPSSRYNTNYNLPKPISSQHKWFIDAFFSCFSTVALPQSRRKACNTTESRPCTQIAIVSSVRLIYGKIHVPDITAHGGNTVLSGIPGMSGN